MWYTLLVSSRSTHEARFTAKESPAQKLIRTIAMQSRDNRSLATVVS